MAEPMPTPMSDERRAQRIIDNMEAEVAADFEQGLPMLLGDLRGWKAGDRSSDDAVRMIWLMRQAADVIEGMRSQAEAFALSAASEKTAALATARAEEREKIATWHDAKAEGHRLLAQERYGSPVTDLQSGNAQVGIMLAHQASAAWCRGRSR